MCNIIMIHNREVFDRVFIVLMFDKSNEKINTAHAQQFVIRSINFYNDSIKLTVSKCLFLFLSSKEFIISIANK